MKRIILACIAILGAAALFAEGPDFSKLPKGTWLDPAWDAHWEIGANSIRILDGSGAVVFDFKDKIKDFKVDAKMTGVSFSFRCDEAERSYVFTKGTSDLDLSMEIQPDWTADKYAIKMKMQK